MKQFTRESLKTTGLILSILFFAFSHNSFARGQEFNNTTKKSKALNNQRIILNKTDTLKTLSKVKIQEKDSVSSTEKTNVNSGASYNILFQVIYRNSFSEIFEEKK
ncbi:MAG: hypothetical protein ACJAT1_001860 [Marivirga sp.]|jgi:hypothetical protein